jgi:hypothetical protein
MTPDEQRSLPFLKTIDPESMPDALHALGMLEVAAQSFEGEQVCMKVSTLTTGEDVGSFIGLAVVHTDEHGDQVHVTVQVEKTVHVSEMPLPRTSFDQVVWVKNVLKRTLRSPNRDPAPTPDALADIMRAYGMMDDAGACHMSDTEIDTVAATPLGTGGIHVVQHKGTESLHDIRPAADMHGPIEVIVTRNERVAGGSRYVVRIAAHCHTTPVPGVDPIERLRMERLFAESEAIVRANEMEGTAS